MNKKLNNIPFFVMFGIIVILIIVGIFKDLEIAKAMYAGRYNGFGLFFAATGVGIPFLFYCLYGGFMFSDTICHQKNKLLKVLCLMYGVGMSVCGWIVAVKEFSGYDAYNIENDIFVYIATLPIAAGLFYLGYLQGKKNQIKNAWIVVGFMIFVMLISYEGIVNQVKHIMHRPRFRALVDGELTLEQYIPFFQKFKDYDYWMNLGVNKNEFKSFPSGHACTSCLMIMMLSYLPMVYPKIKIKKSILFYIGLGYSLFICFTRMLVGAHFITDLCFGFGTTLVIFFIYNKIVENKILKDLMVSN